MRALQDLPLSEQGVGERRQDEDGVPSLEKDKEGATEEGT